jgi:hypothetical protein
MQPQQQQQQQRESENSNSNRPLSCDANVPTAYLKCILGPLLFLLHLHLSAVPPSLPSRYLRSSDPTMRISFSLDFNPVSRLRLQFHRSFFPARETEVRLTSRKSQAHSLFTQQSLPSPADTSRRRGTKPWVYIYKQPFLFGPYSAKMLYTIFFYFKSAKLMSFVRFSIAIFWPKFNKGCHISIHGSSK